MIDIPCVIFTGGKSSRMGEDKAYLKFTKNQTLLQYQYERLKQIFRHVYISCKQQNPSIFKTQNIFDIDNDIYAPTIGFISAFEFLHVERFFAISVDTPFISKKQIQTLINQDQRNMDATIAKTKDKTHPLCGIYHKSLYPDFKQMLQNNRHKLQYLLQNSNTKYVAFEDLDNFLNINNPSQYKKALQLLHPHNNIY